MPPLITTLPAKALSAPLSTSDCALVPDSVIVPDPESVPASVAPVNIADPLSIRMPPLFTVAPDAVPPAEIVSFPPLSTVAALATPSTMREPPFDTVMP